MRLASLAICILILVSTQASAQLDQLQQLVQQLEGTKVKGENREERRTIAIQQSISGLSLISEPSLGLFVPGNILSRAIDNEVKENFSQIDAGEDVSLTIAETAILTGEQEVEAEIRGQAEFSDIGLRLEFDLRAVFAPSVVAGSIELLPFVASVEILDLEIDEPPLTLPTELVAATVNAFLQQIMQSANAVLPRIEIQFPSMEPLRVDLSSVVAEASGLTVQPTEIAGDAVNIDAASIFVSDQGISAIVQLGFGALDPQVPSLSESVESTHDSNGDASRPYERLRQRFFETADSGLDFSVEGETPIAFLAKSAASNYVNASWERFRPTIAYALDGINERSAPTMISLANRPTYSCRSDRNCSFQRSHDTRNCRRCIWTQCPTWREPFRQCEQCINDPVCETAKAAQNAIYEADYAAKKLDCERIKGMENLGCEIGKGFVSALAEVGDIGRIQADIQASGTVTLEDIDLVLTQGLNGGQISQTLSATSRLRVGLDFVPFDIGHVLACPFPGKVFYDADVRVPKQTSEVRATVRPEIANSDELVLKISGQPSPIEVSISPPPIRGLLEQNPQLAFTCNPVLSGAGVGLTILGEAKGVVSEADLRNIFGGEALALMTGTYRHEFEPIEIDVPIETQEMTIGSMEFEGKVELSPKSIVVRLTEI